MFTRRIMIGVILTVVGVELTIGVVKSWSAYHALNDPEHTFPAKAGRALVMSL